MCASFLDFWMLVFVDFENGTPSATCVVVDLLTLISVHVLLSLLSSLLAADAVSRSDA